MNHFGAELRNSQNIRKMTLETQLICSIQKRARANPKYLKFEMGKGSSISIIQILF